MNIIFNRSLVFDKMAHVAAKKNVMVYFILCLSLVNLPCHTIGHQQEDMDFYSVFSGNSKEEMEKLLQQLAKLPNITENRAYKGALLMKLAHYVEPPSEKLKLFKKGRKLLEDEIAEHPQNVEYRFLRLAIQENAPKILNYSNNISDDILVIEQGMTDLEKNIRQAVIDYSKRSKHLNIE